MHISDNWLFQQERYMRMDNIEIPCGSILRFNKGPVRHFAAYISDGMVAHISPKTKHPELAPIERVTSGRDYKIEPPVCKIEPLHLIKRFHELKGKNYSLPSFNCEHFVNLLVNGRSVSKQVSYTLRGGAVGLSVSALFRLNGKQTLTAVAGFALFGLLLARD